MFEPAGLIFKGKKLLYMAQHNDDPPAFSSWIKEEELVDVNIHSELWIHRGTADITVLFNYRGEERRAEERGEKDR